MEFERPFSYDNINFDQLGIRFDSMEDYKRWATNFISRSSYIDRDGYGFCRTLLNLSLDVTNSKLSRFDKYLFTTSLFWWISCGKNGSYSPAHTDPLCTSRGFLGVLQGSKLICFFENSIDLEFINDHFFYGSQGNAFNEYNVDSFRSKLQSFTTKNKIKYKTLLIKKNEAITFFARQPHAVVNFGEELIIGIAGEVWCSFESQKLAYELDQLKITENLLGDVSGSTAHWVKCNFDKVESQHFSNPKHELRRRNSTKVYTLQ